MDGWFICRTAVTGSVKSKRVKKNDVVGGQRLADDQNLISNIQTETAPASLVAYISDYA